MKSLVVNRQTIIVALVLVTGLLVAWKILGTSAPYSGNEVHGHDDATTTKPAADSLDVGESPAAEPAAAKGPHGGRLFVRDGYGVEVTIFEQGVEPQFRVYTSGDGKPLAPERSDIQITLKRLGRAPELFSFIAERDYLKSDRIVEEPHSFEAAITAKHEGHTYRFGYEQIEARVTMSDAQAKTSGVEVLTAGPARIRHLLQLTGEVRLNEDLTVHVVPRLPGIVQSVSVNAGDKVEKDQLIAVISSQALADQRAELLAAQQRMELARAMFEREQKLWTAQISAEQDYLQARTSLREAEIAVRSARQKLASLDRQTSGGDLTRYEIRAPIEGVVVEKHLALGEAVGDAATIFVVADLRTVWAEMDVYAKDLNVVRVGQVATVKASAFESESTGTVFYVGSLVGEQTRAAKARIVLPNPKGLWRPGLPVNIQLTAGEVDVPVAISPEAIQMVRDWTVAFGRYGEDFEARPIELGRRDDSLVEIVRGLDAGEQYAAKGSFLLKADLDKAGASHDH